MRRPVRLWSSALFVGLVLCLALCYLHRKPYTVLALGTLGGPSSTAFALNDRGQVVGMADLPYKRRHAFLWDRGHLQDLGTLGEEGSCASGINNHG